MTIFGTVSDRSVARAPIRLIRARSQRRGFSLAELIMAIALLSVFGVIAARMYFVSDQMAQKTRQLDRAVILVSSLAEQWQASPEDPELNDRPLTDGHSENIWTDGSGPDLADFVSGRTDGHRWHTFLDKEMQPCEERVATHNLEIELSEGQPDGIWLITVTVTSVEPPQDILYQLRASRYFQEDLR